MSETATTVSLRRLEPADLSAYKALRDIALRNHPDAFDSDFETEQHRQPESYLGRLGLNEPLGGTFLLGAWDQGKLVGCIGCERSTIVKTRHRAEVYGLMVREGHGGRGTGSALVRSATQIARSAAGLKMLTATVTATANPVVGLYEHAGFERYGLLRMAMRVPTPQGVLYFDKLEMVLAL